MQQLNGMDEQTLRKYLLGEMSVKEQEDVELWLMSDGDAYDLVEAVEDDIIDDSLNGRLTPRELHQFTTHFLNAPERKKKLQFSRSLHQFINRSAQPAQRESFWFRLNAAFRLQPALAYTFAALLAVIIFGGSWLAQRQSELQRRLDSTVGQLAQSQQQRDALQEQLAAAQTANQQSQPQTNTTSAPAGPTLLAVNLIPSLTRTAANIPTVALASGPQSVQFSLALLDDNYASYRAVIRDADGKEIMRRDGLKPSASGGEKAIVFGEKAIVFVVQGKMLSPADYIVSLAGISDSGVAENVANYPFRAIRR